MSMLSDDAGVRGKTRVYMENCIKAVAAAGSKLVVGPMYSPVGYISGRRRTADEWKH